MKTILFAFIFIIIIGTHISQAQKLEKVWETTTELKTPESVIYDDKRDIIYVSNINGNPSEKDGNGFISILDYKGNIKNLKWATNLNAPKGMAIYDDKLYVSDINQLVVIDIEKREIIKKYDDPDAVFLNDVSACNNGMIFVSDTRTAKIHVLENGEFNPTCKWHPLNTCNTSG